MRTTIKIITSTLIILLLVGLIPHVCITVKADEFSANYILIYKKGSSGYGSNLSEHILVSNQPIRAFQNGGSYTKQVNKYLGIPNGGSLGNSNYLVEIVYSPDVDDWVTQEIFTQTTPSGYTRVVGSGTTISSLNATEVIYGISVLYSSSSLGNEWTDLSIQTNSGWTSTEQAGLKSYSTDIELPKGLTADVIEEMINSSINTTTSATTSANNYQQQALNNYQQYQNGTITLSTLETRLNNIITQLNTINNSASATLADKVAINNALTQTQIINDTAIKDAIIDEMEEDLTTSSNITSSIASQVTNANNTFQNFTHGSVTQSEAVTQINQYITNLTQLITPQTPTADVEAINTAVNTINSIKHSITNYSDLDKDTSESAIQSDKEEIEYLENITAETTDSINSLKSKVDTSINDLQANEVKEQIITPLLQNTLIIKVLPIAALFMVLAVTLGFKYKL